MTVIEFGKRDLKINSVTLLLGVFLMVLAGCSLVVYNSMIGLRHDIENAQADSAREQVRNADLKNELFSKLDGISREEFVHAAGLIMDEEPHYVEAGSISVSHVIR